MTDWLGVVIVALIGLCIAILAAVVIEFTTATSRMMTVTVLDTTYVPASSGVGVGPSVGSSGGGATVLVTSTSAEYQLLVKFPDGHKDFVKTNKRTLLAVDVGDDTALEFFYGGLTGEIIGAYWPKDNGLD